MWYFPLINCNGIPINYHPGAFGFKRNSNYHTGVDLYTDDNEPVYAVEDGLVVKIDYFTGPNAGSPWWEETWGVMVLGESGIVNYGEVTFDSKALIGDKVQMGQKIANVKRVLKKDKFRSDIPGHSTSMLHLELYKFGADIEFIDWEDKKSPFLLDPTPHLINSKRPVKYLTWHNDKGTVG